MRRDEAALFLTGDENLVELGPRSSMSTLKPARPIVSSVL